MYQEAKLQAPSSCFWQPGLLSSSRVLSSSARSARAVPHRGKPQALFGAARHSRGARACWQHPCLLLGMACGGGKLCWNRLPWGPCQHGAFPLACQGQPAKSWRGASPLSLNSAFPGGRGSRAAGSETRTNAPDLHFLPFYFVSSFSPTLHTVSRSALLAPLHTTALSFSARKSNLQI